MIDEKSFYLHEVSMKTYNPLILQGVRDTEHWHPRAKMQGEMGDSAGKTS